MAELVVVDHRHDTLNEVYVLTVGYVQETRVPVLGEDGKQLRLPARTVTDPDGVERTMPGEPRFEQQLVAVPAEEFTFSAADEKWADKDPDAVAKEQKRLVRAALRKRDEAVDTSHLQAMPGVGDPL